MSMIFSDDDYLPCPVCEERRRTEPYEPWVGQHVDFDINMLVVHNIEIKQMVEQFSDRIDFDILKMQIEEELKHG